MTFIDMNNYIKRIYHGGGNPYTLLHTLLLNLTAEPVYMVCDTASSRKPRRLIYEKYKKGRDLGSDPVYFEVLTNCKEMALLFANVSIIDVYNAEADDYIVEHADVGDDVISNDRDMWPLLAYNVNILLNATTKVDLDMMYMKFSTKSPKHIWLYKALVGDPSDKIPGKRGFGPSAWAKLSNEYRQKLYTKLIRHVSGQEPIIEDEVINADVIMCWKLARPLPSDTYDYTVTKGTAGNALAWSEEKGIML